MNVRRVHDRIHGELELPPLVAAVSATAEFCRLDGVRQLGGCAFVYPSATHTRREHSLGVCHLAGKLGRHLRSQRPDLVDADDVLCLQLAGLVHDLGHGPFSHLYEVYVRETLPDWSHETMGLRVLDVLFEHHPEIHVASHFATPVSSNLAFVRLLVTGLDATAPWPRDLVRRPETKRFLTEIVHNRVSGIDVDKLDYLARDALAVFGTVQPFAWERVLGAARVVAHDGRYALAYDEGVAFEIAELYALRASLHRRVYQHRAVSVAEALLVDLMRAMDACLPQGARLVDAAQDVHAFLSLTDASVLHSSHAWSPHFAKAREAHRALYRRPWLARVPATACLRTRPGCAACGARTDVEDAFCAECGASTHDRPALPDAQDLLVPPECALTEAEATRAVRAALGREDVRVHLVDVHCGAAVGVRDPHGRTWRDYDPLREVLFCARDGTTVLRMRPTSFHVAEVRHVRTAHCYLPADATAEELSRARDGFVAWAATVGEVAEESQ